MKEKNIQHNKTIQNVVFYLFGIIMFIFLFRVFIYSWKFGIIILLFFLTCFLLFIKNGKLSFENIPLFLLFLAILIPFIRFESVPSLRPELILILTAWILFIFGKFTKGEGIRIKWTPLHKWFFIFGGCILISIFWAWIGRNFFSIGRDFFEIAKLLEYFLIFALVANLNIKRRDFKKYYIFIIYLFLISAVFGFIQYFDLFHSFNKSFIEYLAPVHLDAWLGHKRIVGTFGNPNDFGILMALASIFSLVGILWTKKLESKFLFLIAFLIFVFSVILTLSRGALISLIVGILFILFWKYPREFKLKGKIKVVFVILPLLIFLSLILLLIAPPNFFMRTNSALHIKTDVSFQARLDGWEESLNIWKQSPIFGWGPGKSSMTTIVDNEWILLLRRYGIVGIIIFILWFQKFYSGIGKIQRTIKGNLFSEMFSVSLQASIISIAIYMIPSAFYHSLRLMPILMTLLGIIYSQNQINNSK